MELSFGSFHMLKWDCNITPTIFSQQCSVMNKHITELLRMTCMVLIFCDSVHFMSGVDELWNLVTALCLHPEVSLRSHVTIFVISKFIYVYNNIVSESCRTICLVLHYCGLPALIQGFCVFFWCVSLCVCVCMREREREQKTTAFVKRFSS